MGFFKRFRKPKAKLTIAVSKNELVLGDELTGHLKVTSQEMLEVKAIGVSLGCWESKKKTRRYQERVELKNYRIQD